MERQYVGIDLHRRRSVIVRMGEGGEELSTVKIENDPIALSMAVAGAGRNPEVVLEACYGWYWAADVLAEQLPRPLHIVRFQCGKNLPMLLHRFIPSPMRRRWQH